MSLVYGITKFIKIISYGVEVNLVDDCVYYKSSGSKFITYVSVDTDRITNLFVLPGHLSILVSQLLTCTYINSSNI